MGFYLLGQKRGRCHEAYPLVRAARYLGVPPWELAAQPIYWRDVALYFESEEAWAQAQAANKPPPPPGTRGRR